GGWGGTLAARCTGGCVAVARVPRFGHPRDWATARATLAACSGRGSFGGRSARARSPPFKAPGVMLVTLSMNRFVGTSVSFTERSRLTEMRCCPSCEKTVPNTQSEWAPWKTTCLPEVASKARTVLSAQPHATRLPYGDQLTP